MSVAPGCLPAFACLPPAGVPLGSSGTRLLGASVGIRVSFFPGHRDTALPQFWELLHHQGKSRAKTLDPALGHGRGRGGFFVNTLPFASFAIESGRPGSPWGGPDSPS